MKDSMEKALNGQINAELYSAYLYYAMSAYFESLNFGGFAHWMRVQAREETEHAAKFFSYINDRGGRVILDAIDNPQSEWESPLKAFQDAYAHEQKVSGLIHDLVDLARKENDHATENFLQWYVEEQVEEEAHASEIAEKLKMIQKSPNGLFMLDARLGQRE